MLDRSSLSFAFPTEKSHSKRTNKRTTERLNEPAIQHTNKPKPVLLQKFYRYGKLAVHKIQGFNDTKN